MAEDIDLTWQFFELAEEHGGKQVILAHQQISPTEHYVVTHGLNTNDKLKCFKLSQLPNNQFRVTKCPDMKNIVDIAHAMGYKEKS